MQLRPTPDGLTLWDENQNKPLLRVDFTNGTLKHRQQFGKDKYSPLARAIGLRDKSPLHILDATCGLGKDTFVLANLGNRIIALEQHPMVFALVADALTRARQHPDTATITERITHHHIRAEDYLKNHSAPVADVIYLDPMFPDEKSTAAVKKDIQILRHLLADSRPNNDALLPLAMAAARYRVVVKRARKSPYLADKTPDVSIEGNANRYDIYTIRSLTK